MELAFIAPNPKYRYYLCDEKTCKQVLYPTKTKIPSVIPQVLDKILLFPKKI